MIGGIPCSGKSTLMREIISGLGSAENVEPMKLFSCQKHNDILVLGRYAEGEPFGGTDRLSYGTIKKFREFIDQEHKNYKHIIFEGDRFFRAVDIEWLLENHDAKVLILTVLVSVLRYIDPSEPVGSEVDVGNINSVGPKLPPAIIYSPIH